ncbi:hypothetical protein WN73_21570 [Bradyrhizobium sp. CCBAU 45394]|uniref:hypothetical protein n=1 Tax=Bradyrhizobium sp. CCBAU 45394 TaxID=1325087 RepID=UPI002302FF39|nr:hypothetical protein [Bradyrhizobium sp. CCBAU 45394]MDA9393103.1 hypothetical protein [Bradyrhizobium sp. CCBAU 45394]
MSLVDREAGLQLRLPMVTAIGATAERSVWLLSASKEDADALRRRSVEAAARPFLLVDLETGAEAVQSCDILLLKTADRPGLDVLIDPSSLDAREAKELAGRIVASFRAHSDRSVPRRSLDLGLVKFASNNLRRERKGWSRNEIENTIDVLLVREMAESGRLTERLCVELLDQPKLNSRSPLRAIALRMCADAIRSAMLRDSDQASALRLYRQAADGFAAAGMAAQSGTTRRLKARLTGADEQLDLWPDVVADVARTTPRIGFHMRRFTGMKLPLASFCFPAGRRGDGPLRHAVVGTVGLEPSMIASWLAKDASPSTEVSMIVRPPKSLNGVLRVDFVIDSELATLSGLAGRGASGRRDIYRLIARSPTCEIYPRFADTSFGRPAPFLIEARDGARHLIRLQVLTRDTPPTSIEFNLPPV